MAKLNFKLLEQTLSDRPEVVAAYLFGSAAKGNSVPRDLDILILLSPDTDTNHTWFNLSIILSKAPGISEEKIDLLFFDMNEADPMVLYEALSTGILLKNSNPDMLSNKIDALSSYFLQNDAMIERAKRLRQERLENFCGN